MVAATILLTPFENKSYAGLNYYWIVKYNLLKKAVKFTGLKTINNAHCLEFDVAFLQRTREKCTNENKNA